nr:RNA-directed DNA polymerase, eukaryota [Tanacetum cinerariifolium]
MIAHTGFNSWFQVIQDFIPDFASEERIVWVDLEGVPLHAWSYETNLNFLVVKEDLSSSDDDSVEGVAETIFDDISSSPKQNNGNSNQKHLKDPFELCNLLSKKKNVVEACVPSPSLSHPPGVTPVGFKSEFNNVQDNGDINREPGKILSPLSDDKIMNTSLVIQ